MAKKKKAEFSMAAEIRKLLSRDRELTSGQVIAALKKKFPGQSINEKSCGVAVSNQRKKLGIDRRHSVRKRKPGRQHAASTRAVDLQALVAARDFLSKCGGDESQAISAIRQLRSLQIG